MEISIPQAETDQLSPVMSAVAKLNQLSEIDISKYTSNEQLATLSVLNDFPETVATAALFIAKNTPTEITPMFVRTTWVRNGEEDRLDLASFEVESEELLNEENPDVINFFLHIDNNQRLHLQIKKDPLSEELHLSGELHTSAKNNFSFEAQRDSQFKVNENTPVATPTAMKVIKMTSKRLSERIQEIQQTQTTQALPQ